MKYIFFPLLLIVISCTNKKREQAAIQFYKTKLEEARMYASNHYFDEALDDCKKVIENSTNDSLILVAKNLIDSIVQAKEEFQVIADEARRYNDSIIEADKNAEQSAINNLANKLVKVTDEFNTNTYYYHKTSPQFVNYNGFFIYMGMPASSRTPFLRLKIQYVADDWLFIEKYMIKTDGGTYTIFEDTYGEIKSDVFNNGTIGEWIDRSVGPLEEQIIMAIIESKKVLVRYEGEIYYKDKYLTSAQINAIRDVWNLYQILR